MDIQVDPHAAIGAVRNALAARCKQLLKVVRRQGGKNVDAEDVLQAALQRALERAEQVRDPARAEAWVGRVVQNHLTDELRKQREPVLSSDAVDVVALDEDGVDCGCVLVQARQLKPEYSTILQRVIVEGVPVKQLASELGLTPNNAMVRLHRARVALKERLAAHCGTTTVHGCSDCGCEERGCCPCP